MLLLFTWDPPHMPDFWPWFGRVANVITVLAGAIAFAGVVSEVLGRARLSVTHQFLSSVAPSLTMVVSSTGSSPVRDLVLNVGRLDENGFSMIGDGCPAPATLSRGEAVSVMGYEPEEVRFGSPPRVRECRFPIGAGEGWFLTVQYQSPIRRWRRSSRTYAWLPERRFACDVPEELTGRKEIKFLERTRDPALNPMLPNFAAPPDRRTRAIVATDETFDQLASVHHGPVLVGFGPTWQGKWWEDAKRVLDVFAGRHAQVKVLVVDTDKCPGLAERFATNEVPVFKVLLKGEVAKSYVGVHAFPDLEREFGEFLG